MVKVWRDFHWLRIFLFFSFSIFWGFIFTVYIKEFNYDVFNKHVTILLFILLIPLYFTINLFRIRLSFVTNEGIRIGNAPDDSYGKIILKQKLVFLRWKDIKYVTVIRREVRKPGYRGLINFLLVKTRDGKKYECFISDKVGFIEALKKLNKFYLVKNSGKEKQ